MKTLSRSVALVLLFACGGAASDPATESTDTQDVRTSAPAVLIGGVVDPLPAEKVSSHDLEVSDGAVTYRVMFGKTLSGAALADHISAVTGATITASVDGQGRLVLTTVETGPDAELHVEGGAAMRILGLELGASATGR